MAYLSCMGHLASTLFLLVWLASGSVAAAASASAPTVEQEARELEQRLLAPCCWKGTLDVHESQPAAALRKEIRTRLAAGESVSAVEASLIARHGEKIRATLPKHLGTVLAVLLFIGGPLLPLLMWRQWRRGGTAESVWARPLAARPAELPAKERRQLEERLDDDLEMGAF